DRHLAAGDAAAREANGHRDPAALPLVLSQWPRSRGPDARSVARREAQRAVREALGRTEAAAGGRLRAGRQSRRLVPRRADDGARSAVAAAAVGNRAALPRA